MPISSWRQLNDRKNHLNINFSLRACACLQFVSTNFVPGVRIYHLTLTTAPIRNFNFKCVRNYLYFDVLFVGVLLLAHKILLFPEFTDLNLINLVGSRKISEHWLGFRIANSFNCFLPNYYLNLQLSFPYLQSFPIGQVVLS